MKKILILGAGVYQVPLIKKAKAMELFTIVASINGNYPGFRYADKVYFEDTTDVEAIFNIAKTEKIDGICASGTDVALSSLGKVCDEMNLKGISYKAACFSNDKLRMKEAFLTNNVRTALFEKASNLEEAHKIFDKLKKPLLFKTVDSSGSRGIIAVNNKAQIKSALNKIKTVSKKNYFIIEEFIEGIEFGAQALIDEEEIIFVLPHGDKVFQGDTGVPIGHYAPYELSEKIITDIKEQLSKSIQALEFNNCAINADFILKDNKAYLLEIGARAGATCLPELVATYYGIDYYKMIIELALGVKTKFNPEKPTPCAAELIISNKNGIIRDKIIDVQEFKDKIIDLVMDYEIGDRVNRFNVGVDRLGHVIIKDSSLASALEILESINHRIKIVVE